jgi:hypothetical protein
MGFERASDALLAAVREEVNAKRPKKKKVAERPERWASGVRCSICDKRVPLAARFERPPHCSTKCAKGRHGTVFLSEAQVQSARKEQAAA